MIGHKNTENKISLKKSTECCPFRFTKKKPKNKRKEYTNRKARAIFILFFFRFVLFSIFEEVLIDCNKPTEKKDGIVKILF